MVVSVVCTLKWGIIGIYIGTIVSRLIYVLCRPYSTYEFLFGESCWCYYRNLALYFSQVVIVAIITGVVTRKILVNISILSFIEACIIVAILPNTMFLLFNLKSHELHSWKDRLLSIVRR